VIAAARKEVPMPPREEKLKQRRATPGACQPAAEDLAGSAHDSGEQDALTPQEKVLIECLRTGDAAAASAVLELLQQQYWRQLVAFARRYVQEADAEDVVNEAFLRLWDERARLEPHVTPIRYLYWRVIMTALDGLRKQKTRNENFMAVVQHQVGSMQQQASDPEELIVLAEKVALEAKQIPMVKTCLAELPAEQEALLLLRYWGNYSQRMIMDILALPSDVEVTRRKQRALTALRGCLTKHNGVEQ
jgi:RNA polymerase sigma factor (sigma-70 family)